MKKGDSAPDKGTFAKESPVLQAPDSTLVQQACDGDADSFTELCQRYYPAMVAIAHSILGDRHLAEDAAQQTFANTVMRLPQLKSKGKFAAWVAAICRNTARDMARARAKLYVSDDLFKTAAESAKDESADAVREAIGKLPAAAREVIFLRFYDGLSYEQISAVLGLSEPAINGRLRRAKRKIADYLRRNGFAEVKL